MHNYLMRGHWSRYIETFFNIGKANVDIKISERQISFINYMSLRTYTSDPWVFEKHPLLRTTNKSDYWLILEVIVPVTLQMRGNAIKVFLWMHVCGIWYVHVCVQVHWRQGINAELLLLLLSTSSIFKDLLLFCVSEYFVCRFIYVAHARLVPMKIRKGHQVLWN